MDEKFSQDLRERYSSPSEWATEETGVRDLIRLLHEDAEFGKRYRVAAPLGVGGVGIVIEVEDLNLKIPRALKIARPTAGKAELFDRIMTEEISQLLECAHPNIIQIYYQGKLSLPQQNCPFYVMEYIEGARDAAAYFDEPRSEDDLIRILRQVVAGLRHLHENMVLHGDMKLENILVAKDGKHAVISDLGSSRHLQRGSKATYLIYTRDYAHPDLQIVRLTSKSDPNRQRTEELERDSLRLEFDVYALGKNILRLLERYDSRPLAQRLTPYVHKYLDLMACRMLDGHNTERTCALGLPAIAFNELKYTARGAGDGGTRTAIGQVELDIMKLTGEYSLQAAVDELDVDSLWTVQTSTLGVTPLTKRFAEIISHPLMRRLAAIPQLGFISLVYPTATHSRFEHVLGTFTNAVAYCNALYNDQVNPLFKQLIDEEDVKTLLLAALLHDIGQYPLAHDLQDANEDFFDHEELSISILEGRLGDEHGRTLRKLIEDWGVDPNRVAGVIKPTTERRAKVFQPDGRAVPTAPTRTADSAKDQLLRSIISGPIDADKLDYLVRDSINLNVPFGEAIDFRRLLQCLTVIYRPEGKGVHIALGIHEKGKIPAETVAFARYAMFGAVYWHHTSRAGKAMLHRAVWEGFEYRRDRWSPASLEAIALRVHEDAPSLPVPEGPHEKFRAKLPAASQVLRPDREIIEWVARNSTDEGQRLIRMLLSRELFGRICVISKLKFDDDFTAEDEIWGKLVTFRETGWGRTTHGMVTLQNCVQRLAIQLLTDLDAAKVGTVERLLGPDAISNVIRAHERREILLLLDIPTQRKSTRTKLEYLPEAVRKELLGDWTGPKELERSIVWQSLYRSFLPSVGKVRLFCHDGHRRVFETAQIRDEIEDVIGTALKEAEATLEAERVRANASPP